MKKVIIGVVLITTVVALAFVLLSGDKDTPSGTSQQPTTTYTKDQVASHSTKDNCWTYINDNVYDITSYVPRHPGGDEILLACGQDGTTLFNSRTTTDGQKVGSGLPHSKSAESQLSKLAVGKLTD